MVTFFLTTNHKMCQRRYPPLSRFMMVLPLFLISIAFFSNLFMSCLITDKTQKKTNSQQEPDIKKISQEGLIVIRMWKKIPLCFWKVYRTQVSAHFGSEIGLLLMLYYYSIQPDCFWLWTKGMLVLMAIGRKFINMHEHIDVVKIKMSDVLLNHYSLFIKHSIWLFYYLFY